MSGFTVGLASALGAGLGSAFGTGFGSGLATGSGFGGGGSGFTSGAGSALGAAIGGRLLHSPPPSASGWRFCQVTPNTSSAKNSTCITSASAPEMRLRSRRDVVGSAVATDLRSRGLASSPTFCTWFCCSMSITSSTDS